jgi:CBS domain-containing protein
VIITDNKILVGMVTEKDIIRFVYSFDSSRPAHDIRLGQVIANKVPITVEDSMSLISCAKLMLNKGISSLIVTHKNSMDIGIITKTDIVDYYSKFYKRLNKVRDYMTISVFSISPDELVIEAMRLLLENKVARIVVIKNDKAIGIITGRDLLPLTKLVNFGFEKYDKKNQFGSNMAMISLKGILFVGDIMRSSLITILGTEDLAVAAKIMIRNRISGLPVVDKNNKLKGIVTKTDIIRAFSKIL